MLHLVRHGAPLVDTRLPPAEWELDPDRFDDVWALRSSGRLPDRAAWYSSPEPRARATAALLHDGETGVLPELREQERGVTTGYDDADEWHAIVREAFTRPERSVLPGWEPLSDTRDRLLPAVHRLLDVHRREQLVLVGHGVAWTLVVSELVGEPPDLARWASLAMPDLVSVVPA